MLHKVKRKLQGSRGNKPYFVNQDCPIKLLQDWRSALNDVIPYLNLIGLASLLRTSRGMREALKPLLKTVEWRKTIPLTVDAAVPENADRLQDLAAINEKILTNLAKWLARYLPEVRLGERCEGPSFADFTRAVISQRGFEKGMHIIKKFLYITSLSLEMDGKQCASQPSYEDSLFKLAFKSHPELKYLEIAGQPWKMFKDIHQLVVWDMSSLLPGLGRETSAALNRGIVLPIKSSIHVFIREKLDLTADRIITEHLSGTMKLDTKRKAFGWKHSGGLRITELLIQNHRRYKILEQCMELNIDPNLLSMGKVSDCSEVTAGGISGRIKDDQIPRYVADCLDLVQYLDETVTQDREIETVDEMMELPLIRLFDECNQCFRKCLQGMLIELEQRDDTGSLAKRLEIFRVNNHRNPYEDAEVLVYADLLVRPKTELPPKSMTFYQPYYVNRKLTNEDIRDLKKLTGLKRIWIRRDVNLVKGDEKLIRILNVISDALDEAKTELDELRAGTIQEVVFVNNKYHEDIKSGKDRRWGPDTYTDLTGGPTIFDHIFGIFPTLRLVTVVQAQEANPISQLSFRRSQANPVFHAA